MSSNLSLAKDECNFIDVARFIGIYLVVFAHFVFTGGYYFLSNIAFSFHMPLFFIISGILHRPTPFSKSALWKIVYALLIPYLIYNMLCILYLVFFSERSADYILDHFWTTLSGENPMSFASWFFLALFWVKCWSLFLLTTPKMIAFSLLCIAALFAFDMLGLKFEHDNLLMLRTSLASYPFFAFGYLIRHVIKLEMKPVYCLLLFVVFAVGNLIVWHRFGHFSLAEMQYSYLLSIYPMAILGSLATLYFSQLVLPYVRWGFVKDVSRGTMIIVGLHYFVMYFVIVDYIFNPMVIYKVVLWATGLILAFYLIIKLTYDRIPILYGKKFTKKS